MAATKEAKKKVEKAEDTRVEAGHKADRMEETPHHSTPHHSTPRLQTSDASETPDSDFRAGQPVLSSSRFYAAFLGQTQSAAKRATSFLT